LTIGMSPAPQQRRAERFRGTIEGTDASLFRARDAVLSDAPGELGGGVRRRPTVSRGVACSGQLSGRVPSAISPGFHQQAGDGGRRGDESEFWLTFVGQSGLKETADQKELLAEASELLAIFAKSAKTASDNDNRK